MCHLAKPWSKKDHDSVEILQMISKFELDLLWIKFFTDRSKAVLLLWILCFFCLVFAMPLCASVYMCCGHLLGKG